jgi:hypothetical protein
MHEYRIVSHDSRPSLSKAKARRKISRWRSINVKDWPSWFLLMSLSIKLIGEMIDVFLGIGIMEPVSSIVLNCVVLAKKKVCDK